MYITLCLEYEARKNETEKKKKIEKTDCGKKKENTFTKTE